MVRSRIFPLSVFIVSSERGGQFDNLIHCRLVGHDGYFGKLFVVWQHFQYHIVVISYFVQSTRSLLEVHIPCKQIYKSPHSRLGSAVIGQMDLFDMVT